MKALLPFFLLLLPFGSTAQWETMNAPEAGRYDDIFFLNDTLGWAVNSMGDIYKTTDGEHWVLYHSTGEYLRSVEFASPTLGFCGSLNHAFYKTIDGGVTWTDIAQSITPQPQGICGISAPTPTVVYGCGIWSEPAFVIKSEDAGSTWESIDMSAYASALVDIYFIDENEGFVLGKANPDSLGGILLYTNDGGDTWSIKCRTEIEGEYVWKIQTPDDIHYFASIQAVPGADHLRCIRSNDGGANWAIDTIFDGYSYMQMIGFIDPNHGWAGGDAVSYETTDGGETWHPFFSEVGTLNRFFRINDNLAYMSGEKVYKFGESSVGVVENSYDEIHELAVSPNPAIDKMNIALKVNSNTHCQLLLYSADGHLLKTVLDQRISPSEASLNLEVALDKIPAQTLYVVLKTNEGTIYRTVVKQ